jgi:hypothetical protein
MTGTFHTHVMSKSGRHKYIGGFAKWKRSGTAIPGREVELLDTKGTIQTHSEVRTSNFPLPKYARRYPLIRVYNLAPTRKGPKCSLSVLINRNSITMKVDTISSMLVVTKRMECGGI